MSKRSAQRQDFVTAQLFLSQSYSNIILPQLISNAINTVTDNQH